MPAPHEVVASPLTIYLAVVGTAFPDIDAVPAVDWVKLGTEGNRNYSDAGVTTAHAEEVNDFTPAGSTMPTKRFRVGESLLISLELVDVSPAAYAKVMNNAPITQVAQGSGIPGESSFSLFRGDQVNSFAVLGRGQSGVDNALAAQYEFSKAFVSVNGEVVWNKGVPAFLPVEILAVKATDADVIKYRVQESVAL